MYSINIPFSYTLQSLNIILTSLTLDNIYNVWKEINNMLSTEMIEFLYFFIPK